MHRTDDDVKHATNANGTPGYRLFIARADEQALYDLLDQQAKAGNALCAHLLARYRKARLFYGIK